MLVIEDDGSGLPPDSHQQGFGTRAGMRERVSALGGTPSLVYHGARVSVSRCALQRYV